MKVQFKVLAAAVVLAAALPAQAAIAPTISGNGSMLLNIVDRDSQISATFDLGKLYSDFNVKGTDFADSGVTASGTNFSWDLTTGNYAQAWTNFLAVASLPNVVYSVFGGDSLGTTAFSKGWVASYASPNTAAVYTSQQATNTPLNTTFAFYSDNNSNSTLTTFQNHTLVDDGASVAVSGTAYAGGDVFKNNRLNGVGPVIFGAVGTDLGVIQVNSAASGIAAANQFVFGNGAKFNLSANGLLTYSTDAVVAVPEADTWAMMLLGLGFMGFIARRKQS